MTTERNLVWFSCGAASAVAAHLTTEQLQNVEVIYCDVMSDEHPDNQRFFADVQNWIDQEIRIIRSEHFASIDDIFNTKRYMANIYGAPCTVEMKKIPRFAYQRNDDTHIFGFTADEHHRIERFEQQNPGLSTNWILADNSITKSDCLEMLQLAGITLPIMYELGYNNNNCLGCVKASSARYWNSIRRDFPDVFKKRATQSRDYGAKLTRVRNVRVFLDELPPDYLPAEPLENISCGPDCGDDTQLSLIALAATEATATQICSPLDYDDA
jgi:hypothetical protein|tara:strand:+ start:547 stop:1356 length:810 start_codon:yes stop_codon:yes gene_type:complete